MNPLPPRILPLLAACSKLNSAIWRYKNLPSADNAYTISLKAQQVAQTYQDLLKHPHHA